jgi:hypothetical protein
VPELTPIHFVAMCISSSGTDGLLFVLVDTATGTADAHAQTYFSVLRHHPDGQRWLEVGRFATKEIAQLTLDALVGHGQGDAPDFRVKRVTLPDRRT